MTDKITGRPLKKAGRPKGSKNVITVLKEAEMKRLMSMATSHMMEHLPKLVKSLVDKANDGDMQAMKMVLDRIIPTRKAVERVGLTERPSVQINISTGALPTGPFGHIQEVIDGEVVDDA